MTERRRVAIVGGGLAGLASAVALAENNFEVELFEARSRLGGRASSYRDPATGQWIDYCQHVSMGCCTNLADLCRRLNIDHLFQQIETLHFIGPDGKQYDVAASAWLPAPLHLLPSLWRLRYLAHRERRRIMRTMLRLASSGTIDPHDGPSMRQWLEHQGESHAAIEHFWQVVLVSALGESLDGVSVPAARKVLVDAFLANRNGYRVLVPTVPLSELFGQRIEDPLRQRGISVHLNRPVTSIDIETDGAGVAVAGRDRAIGLALADGSRPRFDYLVLAASWRQTAKLLPQAVLNRLPQIAAVSHWTSSPITGIHLWFDRPITSLGHAVFTSGLCQWLFNRGPKPVPRNNAVTGHYYQVVVSASHDLVGVDRDRVLEMVCDQLRTTWPEIGDARLLFGQIVTDKHAVFSPVPGREMERPGQRTPIDRLLLAGDWTATGWPSTMESAVRSGYLAAEAILSDIGRPIRLLAADLPHARLARCLLGRNVQAPRAAQHTGEAPPHTASHPCRLDDS